MKKQITFLAGLSLLLGLTFTACEEEGNDTPEERVLYPKTITEYENGVAGEPETFEYNSKKQLIERDYGYGNVETYEYDEDGKVILINYYDEGELYDSDSLIYNDNDQIVKQQNYSASGDKWGWYIYEYNNDGYISKRLEYLSDGTHYSNREYIYDQDGNLINEKTYWRNYESELISTDTYDEINYEYDDKNNILKSLSLPFRYETHINNITKEIFTQTPDRDDNYTITYSYTYNKDNYPKEYIDETGKKGVIDYVEL